MSELIIPTACALCPRRCGADRTRSLGRCGGGSKVKVARAAAHYWEEPCISGTRGSGAVFFSGCALGCVFCQNREISAGNFGKELTVDELADVFRRLEATGVHNLNLVTAGHYTPWVVAALERAKPSIPVVWNSGGYESLDTLRMLDGLVQVYLPDLKYRASALAARYSGAGDYFERASAAIVEMHRQVGACVFDDDDILRRGVLVRHLVLPGHADDSIAVFEALYDLVPPDEILVGLMSQYTPPTAAPQGFPPELTRRVTPDEYALVADAVEALGFEGYEQGGESADAAYTPPFDLKGL